MLTDREIKTFSGVSAYLVSVNGYWKVYEIYAETFHRKAAQFFLDYGYFLSDGAVRLSVIWPVHICSPYLISYKGKSIYFHIDGEYTKTQLFPKAYYDEYPENSEIKKALKIIGKDSQQLIVAGHSNVLRYAYMKRTELAENTINPAVLVTDNSDNVFERGNHSGLPPKKRLYVWSSYYGHIDIISSGILTRRLQIKSQSTVKVDLLNYGDQINVWQGLDIIWSASFERGSYNLDLDDNELLFQLMKYKGKRIPISHRFGNIVSEFRNYPKVRKWICQQIISGYIYDGAYKKLVRFIGDGK